MDKSDLKILDELQRDAGLSTAEIAERVGLSQSQCWRRLASLKETGVIRDQVTRMNRRKLGFDAMVFAHVKVTAHGRANLDEFTTAVMKYPEITECHAIMGPFDFLLRIVTKDMDAYEKFVFGKLSRVPGVQEINSTMALSEIKSTSALPIETLM
ncbi:MAG: Lrp/AsnC family transcriptional regulator [Acidimicrobiales bacterium]|nr:Lrp/AsnC family transcriptional regulator [Hyphomonadaceae bacterium]RZV42693.1 MAG: Lrp/AsnC family transcriptional regulator [Acidimicrobiales bacterium]